jgi:sarcosine oxidase, subunit gamma
VARTWHQMTALGHAEPRVVEIGPFRIVERFDVALASLATRHGRDKDVAKAAKAAKLLLPAPARAAAGVPYGAFWVAPAMWFIEAPFATHEDIVGYLKPAFGDAASLTEQTDAWVRFDVAGVGLVDLFARLSNLDLATLPDGYASRTVIDHLGCYLIRRAAEDITLYGPRSSAESLLHALEVAAKSVM